MRRFGNKSAAGLLAVAAMVTLGALAFNNYLHARPPERQAYSPTELQDYLRDGKTVLVTIEADWAINPSDRPFFMSADVSKAIRQKGFIAMAADWTEKSPEVDALMADLARNDVPALAVYTPANPDSPMVFSRRHKQSDILAALQAIPRR